MWENKPCYFPQENSTRSSSPRNVWSNIFFPVGGQFSVLYSVLYTSVKCSVSVERSYELDKYWTLLLHLWKPCGRGSEFTLPPRSCPNQFSLFCLLCWPSPPCHHLLPIGLNLSDGKGGNRSHGGLVKENWRGLQYRCPVGITDASVFSAATRAT